MARTFERWGKRFSLQIVKGLEEEYIKSLPEDHILIFVDLASGSLNHLKNKKTEIFIFDHHEIAQEIPSNVTMINPQLWNEEQISGAGIAYLFARTISSRNHDLAHLAVIGMVGDMMERSLGKVYDEILREAETIIKKGLMLYPATRPLDKALEYSSNPYIPGVSGSYKGALEVLKDANIQRVNNKFKSLFELTNEEMSALITAVMLRCVQQKNMYDLIGNLYLIKFFNKQEDARELSALINACSRMDSPSVALGFCLGNKKCKEEAERLYISYKQHLIAALKFIEESEKISGKQYTIINARDNIKDTIIGTVTSIISNSSAYETGTIIVGLAYNQDKIKVSARIAGRQGRNVREVLHQVVVPLGGEVGGHPNAAGCLIERAKESEFIQELQKVLEVEVVKV
ncbi:DHH family phosphoesterase [Candidatus Pacearchaeota archaeon]|nr:DHH family phosphoesterase [Candidatus Pacearchaeota archaeon]